MKPFRGTPKKIILATLVGFSLMFGFLRCGSSSGTSSSRTLTSYNTTSSTAVTTAYGGTCYEVTRSASACKSARTALGISGNWLNFSCNVTIGLATSSLATTTSLSSAAYYTLSFVDLPDYSSNYYSTSSSYSFTANSLTVTGNYSTLYSAYTTTYPDPSTISQQSISMYIPVTPSYVGTNTMSAGIVGVAINGIGIYDNLANSTDNIFSEAGSFDQCQGHPANGQYHYHSEPYTISYNDNNLIGVMRDGYFIYGRNDYDGTTPGSITNLNAGTISSAIYKYGGHTGVDPIAGTGSTFHYHLTEWKGCYDESNGTKYADDGETTDTVTGSAGTCSLGSSAAWVDTWFLTGHGNGGVYMSVPTTSASTTPDSDTAGIRYYYGTAGSCTGC